MNFVEANGTALRYDVCGGGATLVLIHEMGGTLESWDLVVPLLSAKRRVVRYDTRGAGLSEKIRGPLSIDTMVDDLIALLDALGISEKVALAGMAVGGAIALHTAVRFPQRVAAVVASSPAVGIAPERRPALLARVEMIEREGVHAVIDTLDLSLSGGAARRRAALRGIPRALARRRSGELRGDLPHADRHGSCAGAAPIACPALVIGGAFDRTPPAAAGRAGGAGDPRCALCRCSKPGTMPACRRRSSTPDTVSAFLDEVGA